MRTGGYHDIIARGPIAVVTMRLDEVTRCRFAARLACMVRAPWCVADTHYPPHVERLHVGGLELTGGFSKVHHAKWRTTSKLHRCVEMEGVFPSRVRS